MNTLSNAACGTGLIPAAPAEAGGADIGARFKARAEFTDEDGHAEARTSAVPSAIEGYDYRFALGSSVPPNGLAPHLLVLWALCLFAAPLAHSQVSGALVSNIAETTLERGTGAFSIRHAQGFETGNNPPGYTVTGVDLDLDVAASGDTPVYTVEIWSDSEGSPGSRLGSLSPPSSIGSGVNSFTTPGIDLDDLEGYFVVVNLATPGAKYSWLGTSSNNETSSQGWQISDSSSIGAEFNESTWLANPLEVRKLRINGLVKPDVTVEVTLDEDTSHALAAADFSDDDTLEGTGVRILTLPGRGSLTLDGASPGAPAVSVTANQLVSRTDIAAGKLKYTPARNGNGNAYASLTFKVNDGTSDSTDTFTMIINVTPVNDAATGTPTISGVARAGERLTAGTGGIDDTEGVPSRFVFQWVRVGSDGSSNPTNVGANSNTYTLTDADVGMKLKVRVSFNDNDGHSEGPLESDAYPTGTDTIAAIPACGNPDHTGGSLSRWERDMTVGNSGSVYGFREGTGGFGELGSNSQRLLDFGVDGVIRITAVTLSSGTLTFGLNRALPTRLRTQMALHVCDRTFPVSADSTTAATWTNTGLDWSGTRNRTLYVSRDGQAPMVSSATVNGATLEITFDENLAATVPPSSAFTVKRTPHGGEEETISASGTPAISGSTLTLTLAEPMTHGHTDVKVNYSQPSNNRLTDRRSNAVASFSDATVTNNTPEPIPMLSIAVNQNSIAEDAGVATVTLSTPSPFSRDQTIDLTLGGTATNPDDYIISDTSLTLPANTTSISATVTAVQDTIDEPNETVLITASVGGSTVGTQQTVTITDDDAATLSVAVNPGTISEDGGISKVTVSTDGTTFSTDQTIALTLAGTATKGTDYTIDSESLTLMAGQSSVTATITATNDMVDDNDETVLITASHNSTTVGTQQTVTISETAVTLSVAVNNPSIAEAAGTSTVTVSTGPSTFATDQTIDLTLGGTATKGTDYIISAESLTLPVGQTTITATVTAVQDTIDEPDETVLITASVGGSTIGTQQTVTIADDDDPPVLSVTVNNPSIAEAGGTSTVTVSTGPSTFATDQTIDLTLGGTATETTDYTLSDTSLTLTAGQTSVTATVMASNDLYDDDAETVIVTARHAGRDIGAVTVTIDDDDAPVKLSFSVNNPSIAEAGGTSMFTMSTGGSTLAQARTFGLTLGGTAKNPDDYTISTNSLTLPANTTSISATVTAVQDTIDEPNETVLISVQGNATTQQTVTITDDDTATLSVSVSEAVILREGGTSTVTVSTGGITFSTDQTIALTLAGTATKDTDYTIDSESLTLDAGDSSVSTTITAANDPMATSDETVLITASHNGTTIGTQQTVTISAPVPPEVSDAYASGTFLTLVFDEDLKPDATPAAGAFEVRVARQGVTVYAVVRPAYKPREILLRLASAVVRGANVTLSYTVPNNASNRLQDSAGNHVAAITRRPVRNTTPRPLSPEDAATGEPAISGMAEIGETLTASPGTIADENGIENAVFVYQWVRVTGLSEPDIDGAGGPAYMVAAEDIGMRLKVRAEFTDDAGNSEARTSAATSVIPDTLVPELRAGGAKVDGDTLRLQYDEALNANSRPAASAFAVTVGGQPAATPTGVAIDGDTVTLTLSAAVAGGDAVTVSYTKPAANPVEDLAGNDAGDLSGVTVANKTSAPPGMPENVIVSQPAERRAGVHLV